MLIIAIDTVLHMNALDALSRFEARAKYRSKNRHFNTRLGWCIFDVKMSGFYIAKRSRASLSGDIC